MDCHDAKAHVLSFLDALNHEGKSEAVLGRFASDSNLKKTVLAFEAGFPGYRLIPKDLIAEGERVALRFYSDLEHAGPFRGLEPSGNRYRIEGIAICRVKGERITEFWLESDMLGLMTALGAAP